MQRGYKCAGAADGKHGILQFLLMCSSMMIDPQSTNMFPPTQSIYTHDDPDNEELDAQGSKIITAITALLIHRAGYEESLSPAANHLELSADSDLQLT